MKATHDHEEFLTMSDTVIVMSGQKVIQQIGNTEDKL